MMMMMHEDEARFRQRDCRNAGRFSHYCWLLFILVFVLGSGAGPHSPTAHVLVSATEVPLRCALLPVPPNSAIVYTPGGNGDLSEGSLATYSCLPGFERFGEASRQCRGGRWTGQAAPICAINVAIRQAARQSSNATEFTVLQGVRQAYEAAAYLAVDGTRMYCSKTAPEMQPRWRLALAGSFPVVAVRIFGDVLRETNDLEVLLLRTADSPSTADPEITDAIPAADEREKSVCRLSSSTATASWSGEGKTAAAAAVNNENVTLYLCNATFSARQVLIRRPAHTALRLCEVEVFSQQGTPCQHPGSPRNGIVKLSHVDWPFPPGAVAVYDCNTGYTRIPTEATYHRTCQTNGTWDVREPVCVTNVAQYRLANQSSLFSSYNYPPWQAIDADLNSCAWTKREAEPWLRIDLLKPYTIHAVSVLLDKERLFYQFHRNLLISITNRSSDPVTALTTSAVTFRQTKLRDAGPGSGVFYLERSIVGQLVTIFVVKDTEKFLGICDVQILAEDETPATPDHCGLQTPPSSLLYTFKKTCYQVQRFSATNWYNAALSCQDNGGSLIFNPTLDTQVFLANVLSNLYRFHTSDDRYWISAKLSKTDRQWTFILPNSSSVVENYFWAPDRPTNDGRSAIVESCIALGGHGAANWSWADYRCDQDAANWICAYSARSCGDPVQPEASALLVADRIVGAAGWRLGDHVQYECAPGFVLTGGTGADSVCQSDGTWSGVAPLCRYVNCGSPPKRNHIASSLLNGTTHYGSFAQYFCAEGAEDSRAIGSSVIGCMANGSWEWLDFACDSTASGVLLHNLAGDEALLVPADAAASVNMRQAESVGVGVGVAVSAVILIVLFVYCGLRYRRKKAEDLAKSTTPIRRRHSPYSTIGRLQANQISGPIAVMQQPDTVHKSHHTTLYDDMSIPQISTQVSISDESYSRSDPEGSLSPSNPSSTYLQSFGKAGLAKLIQKGTLRMRDPDPPSQQQRSRPRGPKLVISSPIECRKTVVLDSGTDFARTGMEVIYAQPAKLRGPLHHPAENQYEYLETARVNGGFGSSSATSGTSGTSATSGTWATSATWATSGTSGTSGTPATLGTLGTLGTSTEDDGTYADTISRSASKERFRRSLPPVDEVYDDIRAARDGERYVRC